MYQIKNLISIYDRETQFGHMYSVHWTSFTIQSLVSWPRSMQVAKMYLETASRASAARTAADQ